MWSVLRWLSAYKKFLEVQKGAGSRRNQPINKIQFSCFKAPYELIAMSYELNQRFLAAGGKFDGGFRPPTRFDNWWVNGLK